MKTTATASLPALARFLFVTAVTTIHLSAAPEPRLPPTAPPTTPPPAPSIQIAGTPLVVAVDAVAPTAAEPDRNAIRIESVEPVMSRESEKPVTWLGIFTEEVSEALSSQLNLNSGEGLLIKYVADGSPAAKAGLEKFDVLVELGDQLLVHPAQLAKLIRSQKHGESIKLGLYRHGKKQSLAATLGERSEQLSLWMEGAPVETGWRVDSGFAGTEATPQNLHQALVGSMNQKVKYEVERSMEEARKTLEEALRRKRTSGLVSGPATIDLDAVGLGGVEIGKDATVVMKKAGSAIRSIAKSDENGTLVIIATPKKRLTAHDKEGKLLFDGEVETPEQLEKLPESLRESVNTMLEQLTHPQRDPAKPSAEIFSGETNC